MATKIQADPAKIRAAADRIEALTQEHAPLYKQLFEKVAAMKASWGGVDNQAYTDRVNEYQAVFQALTTQLDAYVRFLREAATGYATTQGDLAAAAGQLRG